MNISDPEALINLYDWLETIPFSRPKKNLARDFSDGILAAELIKYFFPTLVDLHNYPNSNSLEQKKINWSTLNYKILKKLDFPLSAMTVGDLASGSKRDATEYFLNTLREKIDSRIKRKLEKMNKSDSPTKTVMNSNVNDIMKEPFSISKNSISFKGLDEEIRESSLKMGDSNECTNGRTPWNLGSSDLDSVPRDLFDQKVQELLACDETIQVLKARIQRLENTLQLKNMTIERQQQLLEKLKVSKNANIDKFPESRFQKRKTK